jgi:hypothetical protein
MSQWDMIRFSLLMMRKRRMKLVGCLRTRTRIGRSVDGFGQDGLWLLPHWFCFWLLFTLNRLHPHDILHSWNAFLGYVIARYNSSLFLLFYTRFVILYLLCILVLLEEETLPSRWKANGMSSFPASSHCISNGLPSDSEGKLLGYARSPLRIA